MRTKLVEVELRGRRLSARVCWAGEDLVITIGGGTHPHVGCVVMGQPAVSEREQSENGSPSSSVLTIPPHKEEPIARAVAEMVTRELGCVTVVTAGVHEDQIEAEGIRTYLELGGLLAKKLVEQLSNDQF